MASPPQPHLEYLEESTIDMQITVPRKHLLASGIKNLIGADDQVDQNDYSNSVAIKVSDGDSHSVEVLDILLVFSETGSGAIISEDGVLMFFDANPEVSAGDTALAAAGAEHKTLIGQVAIAAADWVADASGGAVTKEVAIARHNGDFIYAVYKHTGATTINSDAGDDEMLDLNVWWREEL